MSEIMTTFTQVDKQIYIDMKKQILDKWVIKLAKLKEILKYSVKLGSTPYETLKIRKKIELVEEMVIDMGIMYECK